MPRRNNQIVQRRANPNARHVQNLMASIGAATGRAIGRRAAQWAGDRARQGLQMASRAARDKVVAAHRGLRQRAEQRRRGRLYSVKGMAGGTTHTTTRMIIRRTKRKQRFLRKLFKTQPKKVKYINRFGFSWMGAAQASKTIWYSCTHLKFNNLVKYMQSRPIFDNQNIGAIANTAIQTNAIGNLPEAFMYIGKCTFTYELYNPTNYIMTVFIYDLVCKHDTPDGIAYSDVSTNNDSPESCMHSGFQEIHDEGSGANPTWQISDPTNEITQGGFSTYWNTVGTKPTDSHYFNTLWKVKGMKKIVLPPTSSHHHVVVYNPKKKVTQANLFFPRTKLPKTAKNGIGGITQATLFGFQGQVATEDNQTEDGNVIGTLPGKLLVNCIKKVNIWYGDITAQAIVQENNLKNSFTKPMIFTDLVETEASHI